jgi:ParB-like chromosome segregation protein Spo0J
MTDWPADKVERKPVSGLVPFVRNSRTHSDEQIEQVARSIAEWGWTNPVLIAEDGTIIAGHARVLAARKLELQEVPVMVARGWSEAQIRAYVIADNRLAENAGWDRKLLALELQELAGGRALASIATTASSVRSTTTTAPTGARPGLCFRETLLPMSGMPAGSRASWRQVSRPVGLRFRPRSF